MTTLAPPSWQTYKKEKLWRPRFGSQSLRLNLQSREGGQLLPDGKRNGPVFVVLWDEFNQRLINKGSELLAYQKKHGKPPKRKYLAKLMRASHHAVTEALREERRSQLELLALMETTFSGEGQRPLISPLLETSTEYNGSAEMWTTAEGLACGFPPLENESDEAELARRRALRTELCTLRVPSYIADVDELADFTAAIVDKRLIEKWPEFPMHGSGVRDGDAACKPFPTKAELPEPPRDTYYGKAYHDYEHLRSVEGTWAHSLSDDVYNDFAILLLIAALGFHVDDNCTGAGSLACTRAIISVISAPSKTHPFCDGSYLQVGLPRAPDGTIDSARINASGAQVGSGATGMPSWRLGRDFFMRMEGDQVISTQAGDDAHAVISCGLDGARSRFVDYSTQSYTERLEWLCARLDSDFVTALRALSTAPLPKPRLTKLQREWLGLNPLGLGAPPNESTTQYASPLHCLPLPPPHTPYVYRHGIH